MKSRGKKKKKSYRYNIHTRIYFAIGFNVKCGKRLKSKCLLEAAIFHRRLAHSNWYVAIANKLPCVSSARNISNVKDIYL